MSTEIKVIRLESKIVEGKSYSLIKAWTPKGFSPKKYKKEIESHGKEVIHSRKIWGDKEGNIYDIIIRVS
jgi:hypothetical protein